jgi:hypothetical protein
MPAPADGSRSAAGQLMEAVTWVLSGPNKEGLDTYKRGLVFLDALFLFKQVVDRNF